MATSEQPKIAARYNNGKTRFNLMSNIALRELAEVYTKGAAKYTSYDDKGNIIQDGSTNWRQGCSWSSVLESVQRHIQAFKEGEDNDPEMGTKHLANAAWGLFTILDYYKTHPEYDDRIHKYLHAPKIGLDIDEVLADFVGGMMKRNPNMDRSTWRHDPTINDDFKNVKDDPSFWLSLDRKIDPKDIPFEPHCYITSRPIDSSITREWLIKNGFSDRPIYTVGHDKSKVQVAKESGINIMVDDRFSNFAELNSAGICTYLFDAPHNVRYEVGHKRIKNLKEIGDIFITKFPV